MFCMWKGYIALVIVLLLQCGTENFRSKDGNVLSFLEHGQTVFAASTLRIRCLTCKPCHERLYSIHLALLNCCN